MLSALRRVVKGEDVAVLLDGAQGDALPTLPFAAELEVLARSEPLPAAVVATVGRRLGVRSLGDAGEGAPVAPGRSRRGQRARRHPDGPLHAGRPDRARGGAQAVRGGPLVLLLGAAACAAPLRELPPPAAGAVPGGPRRAGGRSARGHAPERARAVGGRPARPCREGRRRRSALRAGGARLGGMYLRPGAGAGRPGARAPFHRHPGTEGHGRAAPEGQRPRCTAGPRRTGPGAGAGAGARPRLAARSGRPRDRAEVCAAGGGALPRLPPQPARPLARRCWRPTTRPARGRRRAAGSSWRGRQRASATPTTGSAPARRCSPGRHRGEREAP